MDIPDLIAAAQQSTARAVLTLQRIDTETGPAEVDRLLESARADLLAALNLRLQAAARRRGAPPGLEFTRGGAS